MKKGLVIIVGIFIVIVSLCIIFSLKDNKKNRKEKPLPKPEVTGGQRGEFGIDKNINESTIDEYLNRNDSVYRDMRMLEDPAKYEEIGGDRYLSGYIKGFEVVPLPFIIPVTNLPTEVGNTYSGNTLFRVENGNYIPNYEESLSIIEKIFPKDKVIFLMCGGGGYAFMTKSFFISLGYDENKIYNIGGYWYYEGKNKVEVKKIVDDKVVYDFDSVPYHNIDFDKLTKIDSKVTLSNDFYNYDIDTVSHNSLMYLYNEIDLIEGSWIGHKSCKEENSSNCFNERTAAELEEDAKTAVEKKANIIDQLINTKKSFIVIVESGSTCIYNKTSSDSLEDYTKDYLNDKKIYSFNMELSVLKKSKLYEKVKYNPAVIIIKDGKIYNYIDSNMDAYTELSKDKSNTIKWLENNIVIK